jgi:hypothetical protein
MTSEFAFYEKSPLGRTPNEKKLICLFYKRSSENNVSALNSV